MAGARNYKGEESEQSKARRGNKADALAGDNSLADQIKSNRERKNEIHERIQQEMNPTRQRTPPQYGQGSHENMDAEGNQDTLK